MCVCVCIKQGLCWCVCVDVKERREGGREGGRRIEDRPPRPGGGNVLLLPATSKQKAQMYDKASRQAERKRRRSSTVGGAINFHLSVVACRADCPAHYSLALALHTTSYAHYHSPTHAITNEHANKQPKSGQERYLYRQEPSYVLKTHPPHSFLSPPQCPPPPASTASGTLPPMHTYKHTERSTQAGETKTRTKTK